jgi:hypothetical protein
MSDWIDEFRITASKDKTEDRIWTRSSLGTSKHIADQAITKLGFTKAIVVNTFGGHISDSLYTVEKISDNESSCK